MARSQTKITTCNVNGIRAAAKKGFFEWVVEENKPDILCLQETRCTEEQLPKEALLQGYHRFFSIAEKKGYSGVALYSKSKPRTVSTQLAFSPLESEGRFLKATFPDRFSVISTYFPSGSAKEERQNMKLDFLEFFLEWMAKEPTPNLIIAGDLNIAHQNRDLRNWKQNQRYPGFTVEERSWLDRWFFEHGFIDTFRTVEEKEGFYTWWSQRGQARKNNVGWRIDYQILHPKCLWEVEKAEIHPEPKFSDHAPYSVTYRLPATESKQV